MQKSVSNNAVVARSVWNYKCRGSSPGRRLPPMSARRNTKRVIRNEESLNLDSTAFGSIMGSVRCDCGGGYSINTAEEAHRNLQAKFGGSGVSRGSKVNLYSRIGSTTAYGAFAFASRVTASAGASAIVTTAVALAETQGDVPSQYALYPTRPSPFNPSTQVVFDLPRSGDVEIVVCGIHGRHVKTLGDR